MSNKLGPTKGFDEVKKLEDKDVLTSPEELAKKIEDEKKD